MDPSQLAATVVTLLSPYLAAAGESLARKAGEATLEQLKTLYEMVHEKVTGAGHGGAEEKLQRLKKSPQDEGAQEALAQILGQKIRADPDFAQALDEFVERLLSDRNNTQFLTQVYGEAKVGKIINIGNVDRLEIND